MHGCRGCEVIFVRAPRIHFRLQADDELQARITRGSMMPQKAGVLIKDQPIKVIGG